MLSIKLSKEPLKEEDKEKPASEKSEEVSTLLTKPDIHSQYGLRFLLDCIKKSKDLNISKELV